MKVTLTINELQLAAGHALLRRCSKLENGRREYSHQTRSPWDDEIESACAELALCKLCGRYWSGAGVLGAADCGNEYDVRWTRHLGTGGLILYPRDYDDTSMVLLEGFAPAYNVVGWIKVATGKRWGKRESYGWLVARELLHEWDPDEEPAAR